MHSRYAIRVLALLLAFALCTFAQINGRLTGTVVDQSGAPIPGATVNVSLPNGTTPVFTTTTSSDGIFAFGAVRPATYDLTVQAQGFNPLVSRNVKVDPSRETALPAIALEVQATQQSVEVTGTAQAVQTTTSEVADTVTQKQILNLPVLDRQVSTLFLTQPGVSEGRGPAVINGMRTSFANVTLDGINIQDNYIRTNSLDYIPNKTTIEQVAEMTIATSNANAALGIGAAQIALATPSGTNQWHGSLYEYNRNSYFSANDWFNNQAGVSRPFLNQNQPGGSLGGHIIKDKLFFYTNVELFRNRQQTPITNTVLTGSARQGIFTYVDKSGATRQANLLQLRNTQIDPYIASLLGQVPTTINDPTTGDGLNTGGYSFNASANEDRNVFLGKVDYYLSTRHSFTGTYEYNTDRVNRPDLAISSTESFYTTVPPIYNDNKANFFSGAWRWMISPTLTNEVRGGFNLAPGNFNDSQKYPAFLLTGLLFTSPVNSFLAQGRTTNTYAVQDNANWVKGKHTVSFGYQSQYIRVTPFNDGGIVPTYTLGISANNENGLTAQDLPGISQADLNTANSLYTTLAGIISDYSQTFNVTNKTSGFVPNATYKHHFAYDTYSGYIQDNYRMNPRLTLNLGLRYDYYTPLKESDNLYLVPQIENGNYLQTALDPNAVLNFPKGNLYKPDRNNFAPTVGFAYNLFGNGKTALRGGYGIYYVNDEVITSVNNNLGTNSGLSTTATNPTGLVANISSSLPQIPTPAFKVPLTLADNYAVSPTSALGITNPDLVTPYVQQYSFGIQHEIKNTIIDVRYVGNHGTKLLRVIDYNQVVIGPNGFLADFDKARANGFAALAATGKFDPRYNPKITGSQPLPVFAQIDNGGYLTNSTVNRYIRQGEAGQLGYFYQVNGVNGGVNFFDNPNILGANVLQNFSNSSYNSLQVDVRRRVSSWLNWQFNYTFAKALSDAAGTDQTRFDPLLDINNAKIERAPLPYDLRHVIKANYVLDLPFGSNRHFAINNRVMDAIFGGWTTSGIITYQSGSPFSILSTRGTLNRGGSRSYTNTADSTVGGDDLMKHVGFFMTGNGPYFIDPAVIGPDGRGVVTDGTKPFAGQIFFNPAPGTIGSLQRRSFYGPWDFQFDASLLKTFRLTERQTLQFRAEAFNLPNHPAFWAGNETTYNGSSISPFNINNPTFGQILAGNTDTFNAPRVMQFGLYYRF